ncbi:MAG TPA: class I SAM-dependent methyltransferase [Vicinamibacteria bacterium]|nr:class I SAM-dependent methyltransferase [Vicinamibacteria bacterium]
MEPFFQKCYTALVDAPNGSVIWWHSLPLPDGRRVNGHHPDKNLQLKMWAAMQIPEDGGLRGKKVLDVGANDGFFTVAAAMAGAARVTAIDKDWSTWPANIEYSCRAWSVAPEVVSGDFLSRPLGGLYDVIFLLGVLYHLENPSQCMRRLRSLLVEGGVVYVETQMSQMETPLPVFEYASDIYPTVAIQDKKNLELVGISNQLFPNEPAVRNLAYSYDFACESLSGPHNAYTRENPYRQFFKLTMRG